MLYPLWTAKAGAGCTTAAAALGSLLAQRRESSLVVDLGGDLPAVGGLSEPAHGLTDWLAAPAASDASLGRLELAAPGGRVSLLPLGAASDWPAERAERLWRLLCADPRPVVVDVGEVQRVPGGAADHLRRRFAASDDSVMVSAACYLAVRRAVALPFRAGRVALVQQAGRSLDRHDVADILGVPVVEIDHDSAVSRSVDAGRLLGLSAAAGPAAPAAAAMSATERSADAPADVEAWVLARFAEHPLDGRDARDVLADLVSDRCPLLGSGARAGLVERVHAATLGLGPVDRLLGDPSVTDILVNGPGAVWVERDGRLARTDVRLTADDVARIIERAFHRNGLSVDRAHPIGDTRLDGGARISVVLPPLAVDGALVAIRRFADRPLGLAAFGGESVTQLVGGLVAARANIVVFGATGTGKTTLVGALAARIDPGERVVTIEDAAELRLPLPHVVRLECRPDNGEGAGRVEMRTLVRAALRLRPDRIVVGEVRGPEALDMVWALASGHAGSLSTCHARSAVDALAWLETFVLLADAALPLAAVRAQVRSAVDAVVGVGRGTRGRSILSVHEVITDPQHASGLRAMWP